jgi:hypothetical protein
MNNGESEDLKELALYSGLLKGECCHCGQIGQKSFQCTNSATNNGGNINHSSSGNFCLYCCKLGHGKKNYFNLKKKKAQNNPPSNHNCNGNAQNYKSQDVIFTATSKNGTLYNNIWICDSKACEHYCKSLEGMYNVREIQERNTVGNDNRMMGTKVGSLQHHMIQLDDSTLHITVNELKYVPNLYPKLFNIIKAIKNRFNQSNKRISICLTKRYTSVTVDRFVNTLSGNISVFKMISNESSVGYTAQGKLNSVNSIDINKFHKMIGHCGLEHSEKTAIVHGLR